MSDTRPTLAKKATRKTEEKRQQALDSQRVGLRVKGEVYVVNPADVSAAVDRRIRQAAGYTVTSIIGELEGAPGLDTVAAFMFAAEVVGGAEATAERFEELLESVTYGDEVDVLTGADLPEDDDGPEA